MKAGKGSLSMTSKPELKSGGGKVRVKARGKTRARR